MHAITAIPAQISLTERQAGNFKITAGGIKQVVLGRADDARAIVGISFVADSGRQPRTGRTEIGGVDLIYSSKDSQSS